MTATVDAIMALADEYARAAVDTFREEEGYSVPDTDVKASRSALEAAITAALQAERERCAKVIEENVILVFGDGERIIRPRKDGDMSSLAYADAIRELK